MLCLSTKVLCQSIQQHKLRPEVEIIHTFKPRTLRSHKKAVLAPNIATIQEEEDGYKSLLSVLPEVIGDPMVTKRLMDHFKERVRPMQAHNLMNWLLSLGHVKDDSLEDVMEGNFPHNPSKFTFVTCRNRLLI